MEGEEIILKMEKRIRKNAEYRKQKTAATKPSYPIIIFFEKNVFRINAPFINKTVRQKTQ